MQRLVVVNPYESLLGRTQVASIANALSGVRTLCLHGCELSRMELAAINDNYPRVHMTLLAPARRLYGAMPTEAAKHRDNGA